MNTAKKLGLALSLIASSLALPAYAGDYVKIDLPQKTDSNSPQAFYCTATPNEGTDNPLITLFSHAQLITGFLNRDYPNYSGRLDISTVDLNKYYFNAFQDPTMLKEKGWVMAAAATAKIKCELGDGGRTLHPGAYGKTQAAAK